MSELSQSLKKAILVFTHASDFIVSLHEGAYGIAEDISDKMAADRKLYNAGFEEQFLINEEIGGSVAFFGKLLPSFLIIQISLLEDCLLQICEAAAQAKKISFEFEQAGHFTTEQALAFLENKLGFQFPNP